MLALLIVCVFAAYLLGRARGWNAGWRDGIKIARHWETSSRDWRMMFEMAAADDEQSVNAAYEVRQLNRMYDGV